MVDIINWLSANWIELFGVLTGAGAVFFLARNNGLVGWSLGVINAVFFTVLFFDVNLFADLTLNVYYFVTSALGLYWWKFGGRGERKERKISHLDVPGWLKWVAVWIVGTFIMGYVLNTYTAADIAYLDSFTTVGSLIGQFLLARKVFENWYIWIFVDVIDIFLYGYKGLWMVVGLTAVYMALCVMALGKWRAVEQGEQDDSRLTVAAEMAAA